MQEIEEWRPVEGWPYEVSNLGRVRRSSAAYGRTSVGKILKTFPNSHGYLTVTLSNNAVARPMGVHRLVCAAFHGRAPDGKPEVAHRNGNKIENTPQNLYWADTHDNARDRIKHGRSRHGQANNLAKLADQDAIYIRALHSDGWHYEAIAALYDVHKCTAWLVTRNKTFRHLISNSCQ